VEVLCLAVVFDLIFFPMEYPFVDSRLRKYVVFFLKKIMVVFLPIFGSLVKAPRMDK